MSSARKRGHVFAGQYVGDANTVSSPVYGAWVAVEAILAALLEHGTWDRYELFCTPSTREGVTRRVKDLRPSGAQVLAFADLMSDDHDLDYTAWFQTSLDARAPFYIRDRFAARPFPITALHHTLSYQSSLHELFLPLALANSLPCDSIICPTAASKQAVEILLGEVAIRFNARYGTKIGYRGRLDIVPLGVDTEVLRPRDQLLARRELGLPADPLMLLWLGRISAGDKADLSPLLHAFADVQQYCRALGVTRPTMLVIAGADPYGQRTVLEQQARTLGISHDLRVVTQVDAFRRAAFYAAADIFVAPTDNIQETFGITPVEAMACGLPQVVADWDGYRDTVVHEHTGLLVPTIWAQVDEDLVEDPFSWQDFTDHAALAQSVAVDPAELRGGLMKLILDDDLRRRMGVASRARAQETFAWPKIVASLEALWVELRATADALPPLSDPRPDEYFKPFFQRAFGHYATRMVNDEQRIVRSPSGSVALETGKDLAPRYGDLDPEVMRQALEHVDDAGATIGAVLQHLRGPDASYRDPSLRRQIMRLVKYGYAQLA